MKKWLLVLIPLFFLFTSCSKSVEGPARPVDVNEWMQTHEQGVVAQVDFFSGNYMVQTRFGYSVVEAWGATPRTGDVLYAHLNFPGTQQIYNRSGQYFTTGRIQGYGMSYFQALELLDWLRQ
jgi:hypothetical protein